MDQREQDEVLSEVLIMEKFSHRNVVNLVGISYDDNGSLMIVMPYLRNGNLRDYLINNKDRLSHSHLKRFAIDAASGEIIRIK